MKLAHDPLKIPEVIEFVNAIFPTITWENLSQIKHSDLENTWRSWIANSSYNVVQGLDLFQYTGFVPGTTDAFGEFIARYPNRRVRVSQSDFVLTRILANTYSRELLYLEDTPLNTNDLLIMSFPFSGNGGDYPACDAVLDLADKLQVPVFVDAAYFGISKNIRYPLHRSCIRDFAISLSKNMVGNPLRLGIRFTKDNIDDGVTAGLIGSDVYDRLGSYLSIQLLKKFSHDWIVKKYLPLSEKICQDLKLQPTKTFTLALGPDSMSKFKRGDYVRICITDELNKLS